MVDSVFFTEDSVYSVPCRVPRKTTVLCNGGLGFLHRFGLVLRVPRWKDHSVLWTRFSSFSSYIRGTYLIYERNEDSVMYYVTVSQFSNTRCSFLSICAVVMILFSDCETVSVWQYSLRV